MTSESPTVYIAYCHSSEEDVEWAKQLAYHLRSEGIQTLLDVWELRPGMDRDDWYRQSILVADVILLVATPGLVAEVRYRQGELPTDLFLEVLQDVRNVGVGKRLIPLLFPGVSGAELPFPFTRRVGVHVDPNSLQSVFANLADVILRREVPVKPPVRIRNNSPRDPSVPVQLPYIKIEHFRRIGFLELHREAIEHFDDTNSGQWTLLLGDNGAGKSSFLWALGMGLLDRELIQGILAILSTSLIQNLEPESFVFVVETTTTYFLALEVDQGRERIVNSSASPDFMVFGYGSARGSAFGGPRRAVDLDRPLDAVSTLYGIRTNLIHAETWLQNLERGALKAGEGERAAILFQNVCSVLKSILPGVDDIRFDAERVVFIGPAVGECSTDSLSDGYATTLGWIVDMMARWIHEQQRHGREIPAEFNLQMTGLVLIDELDLHLHPRWQMRIVDDVRRAFPKMSFVATTHNPLTLLGANPGEIHVLDQADGETKVRQVDLPPGIRADQILTGIWFGLSSTLDQETQQLLDQHRELLRMGTPQTDNNRLELEHQLRLRLGSYADTSEDRLAQEIVSSQLKKNGAPLTTFELETVRDKVQKALAPKP